MSDSLRGRVAFNNSWRKVEGLMPTLNATDPEGSDYGKTSTFPNYSVSANMDWVASPNLFFGVRGGYYMSDWHDTNVTEVPRFTWTDHEQHRVPGCAGQPAARDRVLERSVEQQGRPRTSRRRLYGQADGTVYGKLGGDHQLKFGVQVDRVGNKVDIGETDNVVTIRWNLALSGQRGTYGYYSVRSAGPGDSRRGFVTVGDVQTTNIGLFLQDAWTINNKLTINAGVRTERETRPVLRARSGRGRRDAAGFRPRVRLPGQAGAARRLRLRHQRRRPLEGVRLVGHLLRHLQARAAARVVRRRQVDSSTTTRSTPSTGRTSSTAPACPPACPGRLLRTTDFRHISVGANAIDPDLKPMKQQEATAGIEHQLNDVMSLSVRYVHKQIDRAIEDTQTATLDADGNEIYIIANPGEGLAEFGFRTDGLDVRIPKPVRDYDSVEFAVEKRFADRWYLRSSYLWSRLFGNYSGLSQSDEDGRTSPNVGRLYDYPMMMFQDGGTPVYGPLATDRPHQFKTQFIYQFPMGTSMGVNQYVASGLPVSREIGIFAGNNLPVNYLGRLSDGRTPTYSQTDLLVQHSFRFAGTRSLQVSFNVLNLFNQDTSVGKFSTYHKVNGPNPNDELFYRGQQTLAGLIASQNILQDPRFLMDNRFQAPIQARFGVKFLF